MAFLKCLFRRMRSHGHVSYFIRIAGNTVPRPGRLGSPGNDHVSSMQIIKSGRHHFNGQLEKIIVTCRGLSILIWKNTG